LKVFYLKLDARFIEKGIDMGAEGNMEGEVLFQELLPAVGHAESDAFEHTVFFL
jgi:hypothetical protein